MKLDGLCDGASGSARGGSVYSLVEGARGCVRTGLRYKEVSHGRPDLVQRSLQGSPAVGRLVSFFLRVILAVFSPGAPAFFGHGRLGADDSRSFA